MSAPGVSVVIVNYNAGSELARALESIAADLGATPWEAVVVDNASSDGSSAAVARFAPQARVLRNEQNLGFARGVNQGLAATSASKRNVVVDPGDGEAPSLAVDWLSGACILARRDVLVQAKGFDERYFLYWEDADLCRRVRALGYQVRYVPTAAAIHQVGHSSRRGRAAAVRAFHESAYLFYAIHVDPPAAACSQRRFTRAANQHAAHLAR